MEQAYERKPFHQQFAEQLIDKLKTGSAPWQKGHVPGRPVMPINPISGSRFRGPNSLMLMMQDHDDNRWMTFEQAKRAGYQVKSGEKGTPVQFWVYTERVNKIDPMTGQPELDSQGNPVKIEHDLEKPRAMTSYVFNAEQIEGIPPQQRQTPSWNPHERAEEILQNTGVPLKHDQADRVFYSPVFDEIHLPPKERFDDIENYYDEALHTLVHATAHESRLNRNFRTQFGEPDYAREELVAEIGTHMLTCELDIAPSTMRNAAFTEQWIKVLENHPMELCRAAQQAEASLGFILSQERERHPERNYREEEKRQVLLSSSPELAVEQYFASRTALAEAKENPENVHVFHYQDKELVALKGTETLFSAPNHSPAVGEEFTLQCRVAAYDADGTQYQVKMEESLRRLETGLNEEVAPSQALDISPAGRESLLPVDWTGELFVRGCIEVQPGEVLETDLPDNEVQFFRVYASLEDGTERPLRDFDSRDDADSFANLLDHAYKRQTGQEVEQARERTDVQAYINVPFAERREARARGAAWDGDAKSWYIPVGVDAAKFPQKWPEHDPSVTQAEQTARLAEHSGNSERLYINVPKVEKDDAKALGARWDRQAVSWYVPDGVDPEPLTSKWPAHQPEKKTAMTQTAVQGVENGDRIYLLVPYREKDEAKRVGARFDPENKQWYAGPDATLDKLTRWLPENQFSVTPEVSPREEFARQLESFGALVDGEHPIADSQSHRITMEGDKGTEKSGFYVLHPDGHPAGYIMNNRTQRETVWTAKGYNLDPSEADALRQKAAETLAKRETERTADANKTAERLQKQLQKLPVLEAPTSYHEAKGIQLHPGLFVADKSLCIPAYGTDGEVRTVQYIQEDGTKRFPKKSEHSGYFHAVGGLDELKKAPALVVSEGYATAATVSETLGYATVAAFNAANLKPVVQSLHEAMPDKPIIIAADDDMKQERKGKPNAGKEKALEAAEAVEGKAVFPVFAETEREDKDCEFSDFNDLATKSQLGRDAVKSQLEPVIEKEIEHYQLAREQNQENEKSRSGQELART